MLSLQFPGEAKFARCLADPKNAIGVNVYMVRQLPGINLHHLVNIILSSATDS